MAEAAKTKGTIKHVGVNHGRLESRQSLREKVFSEHWQEQNSPGSQLNFGHGTLQVLLSEKGLDSQNLGRGFGIDPITERDAAVAATVIQWLGSNIGFDFLTQTMKRIKSLREDHDILENSEFRYSRRNKGKMPFTEALYFVREMLYLKKNSDPLLAEYIEHHLVSALSVAVERVKSEAEALELLKVLALIKERFPKFKRALLTGAFKKCQKIIVG